MKLLPLFDVRGVNELRLAIQRTNEAWGKSSLSKTGYAWGGIPAIVHGFSLEDIGARP